MLKHAFTLQYGLDWGGETRFKAALKPLTIGAELDALAEIEALGDLPDNAAESQKTRRQVQETLIYWARQFERRGLRADFGRAGRITGKIARRFGDRNRRGGANTQRSWQTSHQNYRRAVIIMAKSGIGADAVAGMCHAELSAWLADVLQSLGAKVPTDDGVIVSRRLPVKDRQP